MAAPRERAATWVAAVRAVTRIGHLQLADTPGRHELASGEINYPSLLDFIDRIGYGGWICCEYAPASGTEAGLAWPKRYL